MKCVILIFAIYIAYVSAYYASSYKCGYYNYCYGSYNHYDVKYPFYLDPNYYYSCNGNQMVCQQCPERNLVYNQYCDACISKYDSYRNICPTGSTKPNGVDFCGPDYYCHGKDDSHQYFRDPNNYQKFFACVAGKPTQCQTCPGDLVFSEFCNQCLYSYNQNECDVSVGKDGAEISCDPFCEVKPNGDYERYPKAKYYNTCTEARCVIRPCPAGLVYAAACKQCVSKKQYTQNPNRCPPFQKSKPKKKHNWFG